MCRITYDNITLTSEKGAQPPLPLLHAGNVCMYGISMRGRWPLAEDERACPAYPSEFFVRIHHFALDAPVVLLASRCVDGAPSSLSVVRCHRIIFYQ